MEVRLKLLACLLQMQYRKRLAIGILLITPHDLVAHVQIEAASLFVVFIHIYSIDAASVDGIIRTKAFP